MERVWHGVNHASMLPVAFNGCVWPLLNNSTLKDPKPVEQQVFYYRGNGNGYTNSNFLASHWYWNHEICSSGRYLCGQKVIRTMSN